MSYVPYRTPEQWKEYFSADNSGVSDDQKVRIDILGMLQNIAGPTEQLAPLFQNGSMEPSVFKDANEKSAFLDDTYSSVFIDDTDSSVFKDTNNYSAFIDGAGDSVFKKPTGGSLFRVIDVFCNTLVNPANNAAVQLAILIDLENNLPPYRQATGISFGYYVNGGDVIAYWTIQLA